MCNIWPNHMLIRQSSIGISPLVWWKKHNGLTSLNDCANNLISSQQADLCTLSHDGHLNIFIIFLPVEINFPNLFYLIPLHNFTVDKGNVLTPQSWLIRNSYQAVLIGWTYLRLFCYPLWSLFWLLKDKILIPTLWYIITGCYDAIRYLSIHW